MTRIVVIGDHRRPIWLDPRVLTPGGRGERARKLIFEKVASERPDLVVITGDLVPGAFERSWREFDRDVAELRKLNIPIEAVPGNHETYGILPRSRNAQYRMRAFLERFPRNTQKRWGARACGTWTLLLLDSNDKVLSDADRGEQEAWIEESTAAAEADPKVTMLIAVWHHPPFTNTISYDDDRFSSRSFLPRLRKSSKLGAIFCGHVHGYERFWVESASLVISGGGGAHRHKFPRDHKKWRHTPAYDGYGLPHLHYVIVDAGAAPAAASTVHLKLSGAGGASWLAGDRFEIRPRK